MPLPSSYVTAEQRESKTAITSSYFDAREIEENSSAELIICGEPTITWSLAGSSSANAMPMASR